MAFSAVPFALQNVPVNADVVREAISSLIPNTGGLVQPGDLAVTQTSVASMAVQIGVGRAWMPGNNIANVSGQTYSKQGQYYVLNDAALTVSIATANNTNPRIDTIYVAIQDATYSGTANGIDPVNVVTGNPNSNPVATAAPSNSITLATVYVAANATNIINSNITSIAAPYNFRHAEFTGPVVTTIANGGITVGTLTADSANTFNGGFATGSTAGQITINSTGVYLFSFFLLPAANPSNTNLFIQTGGATVAATVGGWYGSQQTTLTASFYAVAGTTYTFGCTTSNSVSTGSRVRVTKLQGL